MKISIQSALPCDRPRQGRRRRTKPIGADPPSATVTPVEAGSKDFESRVPGGAPCTSPLMIKAPKNPQAHAKISNHMRSGPVRRTEGLKGASFFSCHRARICYVGRHTLSPYALAYREKPGGSQ